MAFLRCEVWFDHHFKAYIFFWHNWAFFRNARKKAFGLGGGIFASVVGEANDFLLDRIVENERESKKPKMSGVVSYLDCTVANVKDYCLVRTCSSCGQ